MIITNHPIRTALVVAAAAGAITGTLLLRSNHAEPVAAQVIAHTQRGTQAWMRSCPTKLVGGLCTEHLVAVPAAKAEQPYRCGPDALGQTVIARAPADVADARAELAGAIALYERGATDGDKAATRRAYVEARLALADAKLEGFLALPFPTDLTFDPKDRESMAHSTQRFLAWLGSKQEAAAELRGEYRAIAALNDPIGAVAAAARIGQISQDQAEVLLVSPIPAPLRTGEHADAAVGAYCDAMTNVSEPYEREAVTAFTSCFERAAQLGATAEIVELRELGKWSGVCMGALAQHQPEKFSLVGEMLPTTDAWEPVRLQLDLGNFAYAVGSIPATASAYDRALVEGIASRMDRLIGKAEASYQRAIALDDTRPEAHYNLGLLLKDYVAATTSSLDEAKLFYGSSSKYLANSAARATGERKREAQVQLALTQKTIAQIDAFQQRTR